MFFPPLILIHKQNESRRVKKNPADAGRDLSHLKFALQQDIFELPLFLFMDGIQDKAR